MAGLDVRAYNRDNGWVVVWRGGARIYTIQRVTMLELMLQHYRTTHTASSDIIDTHLYETNIFTCTTRILD